MSREFCLQPPKIIEVEGAVIFLGGPIKGAPLWHPDAVEMIQQQSNIVVASPRVEHSEKRMGYSEFEDWRIHFIRRAGKLGVVMFWLAKQVEKTSGHAYAQTEKFELAEAKDRHEKNGENLVVGIEPGFGGEGHIRSRFFEDCPDVPILDNLYDTTKAAVELAS